MSRKANRCVVIHGNKAYVLSQSGAKIIKALLQHGPLTYVDLRRHTRVPKASLYTFTGRLVRAGLVRKHYIGSKYVELSIPEGVTALAACYVG